MDHIYLDNAATTQIQSEVVDCMTDILRDNYGNASSTHSFGRSSKAVLEQCRKNIAGFFNAQASEIIFTSGGTEADNLAMRSAVRDLGVKAIITTKIEHHAVLHTAEQLMEEYGVQLYFVDLDADGQPRLDHLEELLSNHPKALVSLMHVNNEIGNILDLGAVGALCQKYNALFHSDMVQSVGHFHLDVESLPIHFFAASANPWAWLPALAHTIPFSNWAEVSALILL